jgi:hypothetical protein
MRRGTSCVALSQRHTTARAPRENSQHLPGWAGVGGTDPAPYADALTLLEAATGPLTLTLPGHVLAITPWRETPDPAQTAGQEQERPRLPGTHGDRTGE